MDNNRTQHTIMDKKLVKAFNSSIQHTILDVILNVDNNRTQHTILDKKLVKEVNSRVQHTILDTNYWKWQTVVYSTWFLTQISKFSQC